VVKAKARTEEIKRIWCPRWYWRNITDDYLSGKSAPEDEGLIRSMPGPGQQLLWEVVKLDMAGRA
jgi:hypothetical protein